MIVKQYLSLLVLSAAVFSMSSCNFLGCNKNCETKKTEVVEEQKAPEAVSKEQEELAANLHESAPVEQPVAVAEGGMPMNDVTTAESNVVVS